MIHNYFKIAWRTVRKNKMYSAINIGGLAVGMAVALLIGLWVHDEVSYNRSHGNFEHIAQIYRRAAEPIGQQTESHVGLPQPVAKVLKEKYGHLFRHVALLWWDADYTLRVAERSFSKTGLFIESSVIDMFSLKMIQGNAGSLTELHTIIVSESTAKSLFGDKDPINQIVSLNNDLDFMITGVYADIAHNSVFGHVQFFGNFEGLKDTNKSLKAHEDNWNTAACRIFVQTADHVSMQQANAAIASLYLKDAPEEIARTASRYNTTLWLHTMDDWHLYSSFTDGFPSGGRITFVWLFSVIGIFVLLLACINFINLTTARNEKKAKEVGIRKAVGSMQSQLILQFLSEAFVVVFLAMVLAVTLTVVSLSAFNGLAEKSIHLPYMNIYFWLSLLTVLVITSCTSGLYPAFYLSSFKPLNALKGTAQLGKSKGLPRKILVVTQVTVSVVLIIGTIVVYQQIQFAQDRAAGYEREGLIRISNDADFNSIKWAMRDKLLASGVATQVAFSSSPVTATWENREGFTWNRKDPDAESSFTVTWVNEDYGNAIQWSLLQGRDFSRDYTTDRDALIINQSAANYMGLENPLGEFVALSKNSQQWQIIGVVKDVIAGSVYDPVSPAFYFLQQRDPLSAQPDLDDNLGEMIIRLHPDTRIAEALAKIESIQSSLAPSSPFVYSFVDDDYNMKFKSEQRIGKLAFVFTAIAILLSGLGLFGLASFVAEQKTKEIGVRKIVGASTFSIWRLLSTEFLMLGLCAFAIAAPIAYYYLHQWLKTYSYHTTLNFLVFIYAGVGVALIILAAVSYHTIRASLANPVKNLRSE